MSKLNEEILDTLHNARQYMTCGVITEGESDKQMRGRLANVARLDRLWAFFHARRHIEECRREEE